jgi:lipoprotein-releasing system permease protein
VIDGADSASTPGVLLSRYLAKRLAIGVGDTITIYLVKGREEVRPRKFAVKGLYQTGLEKIDHQLVFIGLRVMQRFAQWGLRAEILVTDTVIGRASVLRVEGMAFGGDRLYNYEWPMSSLKGKGPHFIDPRLLSLSQGKVTLVVSDESGTLPDTAWVRIIPEEPRHIIDSWGEYMHFTGIDVERGGTGGTYDRYAGGYEVTIDDLDRLAEVDDAVYRALPQGLRTSNVRERFGEIFAWLNLLDTNVVVVIVLMVIVAIINMTSALLIIILERTTMIGVLKALGTANGTIRRIFLIDAAYILGFGIVLGDLLGIGLCLLQQRFGLVRLPIESYYVDQVPVHIDPVAVLALNAGTLAVCVAALVLPSMLVSRIAPARAIRFD